MTVATSCDLWSDRTSMTNPAQGDRGARMQGKKGIRDNKVLFGDYGGTADQ